ncbi:hypothetical protein MMC25_007915 [Agyrium rufum]|nr:hypothetical protein [Agyrium rufum]
MSTGQTGSATSTSSSLSALVSTLVPVALLSGAFTLVFLILRRSQRRQYAPRTYLAGLRPEERSPDLPKGLFNWLGAFYRIPDSYVLNHHSLDGFLLLRFLKIAVVICFVGCLITWPVLFPINITGGAGGQQLALLSFANVDPMTENGGSGENPRYYAHTFVAWVFFTFIWIMITREHVYYINLRQAYLLSPLYSNRISSRTVIFNSVPDAYLEDERIRRMFGRDKVKNLWVATDCKKMEKLVEERDKVAYKLEAAEVKLIKLANDNRMKAMKKSGSHEEPLSHNMETTDEPGAAAAKWVPIKKRPTHRLKPIIGKKVDTINWCRTELERLIPEVEAEQAVHRAGNAKKVNSVFVEFYTQSEAQQAFQSVAHHQALHMSPRFIGVNPEEVIWKNLKIKWWERIIRNIATISFVCALVIFWSIPVAVVGAISNITYLTQKLPWLGFINKAPTVILGLITGLLPSVALAVLMALLPIILRLMAKIGGMPSLARVELRTQNFYFSFQVVQVFLVTTLSSAAAASVQKIIDNPASALNILATQLPLASNFYISFFILQGLTLSSGAVLQIVGLILFRVLGKILDKTPRKMYKRWISLSGLGWGTVFPVFTNMMVIAITYCTIAPLVLGFATIGLYLIYLAYRYNLLFVFNTNIDTKGLVYPRALQQTTTGIYLATFCMIGLFGISKAFGPLVLMVVFAIFQILYHISMNAAFDPLLAALPVSLNNEEETLLSVEAANTNGASTAIDGHQAEKRNGHNKITQEGPTSTNGTHNNLENGKDLSPLGPAPHKKPNFFSKWLHPEIYCDYPTLRRLVPREFADISYAPETERDAYYNPSVKSPTPLLWIPRDPMGISRQEVLHTARIIPITDEGAHFDDKGKISWNVEDRPPIYQEKIYY